jgi:hypothetical protein
MSHMLFHPEIQRATNARLAGMGLELHQVATEQGRPAVLELRDLDGNPEGIRLTHVRSSERGKDGSYVGVKAWVDEKVSPVLSSSLLSAVMDAEEGVHQDTKGASKPTYGVDTLSLHPAASHLKGRLAAADWRQEVTYPDEPVPQARASKAIRLDHAAEIPLADGTLLRVPPQGYLAIGTDGLAKALPKTALFAPIEGLTREHGAAEAQGLAERMVAGLKAVRAIEGNAKSQHVAVLEEAKGGASLVTELPTGEIATLRTLPSAALARQALDTYGPSYDQEAAARTRRAAAQDKAQATR